MSKKFIVTVGITPLLGGTSEVPKLLDVKDKDRGVKVTKQARFTATAEVIAEDKLMAAIRAVTYLHCINYDSVIYVQEGPKGIPAKFKPNPQTYDIEPMEAINFGK